MDTTPQTATPATPATPMDPTTLQDIALELDFSAPPERVFAHWVTPTCLANWFAPVTYSAIGYEVDARVGGSWSIDFRSEAGETYRERGVFQEIVAPRRIVMTLVQEFGGDVGPETTVTAEFEPLADGRTRLRFTQTGFTNAEHREGTLGGWSGCFVKLAAGVAADAALHTDDAHAEQEIRTLFAEWRAASARKDLDASMEPIADDIVSYEHEAPLQYVGVDAIRPVCQGGFDLQPDNFQWEVPDLQVIIRGDIAVTWGLNHMHAEPTDGEATSMWSRGTRIFQKRDGRWQMIHQHVSFPVDNETGRMTTAGDAAAPLQ